MNEQNYQNGWQIACWSTLAVPVLGILVIVATFFSILQALAVGAIGFGFYMAANELVKKNPTAGVDMKNAAMTLFIVGGLYLVSTIILTATDVKSVSGALTIVLFAGLLNFAAAFFMFRFRGSILNVLNELGVPLSGFFGAGVLVYAIGLAITGFGEFLIGIESIVTGGLFTVLGAITGFVGAILWIIAMFQATNFVVKK